MEKQCQIQSKIYEKKSWHQNQSSIKTSHAFLKQTSFISLNQSLHDEGTSLNEQPVRMKMLMKMILILMMMITERIKWKNQQFEPQSNFQQIEMLVPDGKNLNLLQVEILVPDGDFVKIWSDTVALTETYGCQKCLYLELIWLTLPSQITQHAHNWIMV